MIKPISRMSAPTPESLGPTPRLRPAQAAPVRRESVQIEGDDPRGDGRCMFGITPSLEWTDQCHCSSNPFAGDDGV